LQYKYIRNPDERKEEQKMYEFTRRRFIKILGQGSAILGLGLSSRKVFAQGASTKSSASKLKADVAVIGAGPGGLPAALHAAELGLSVCLFEKLNKTGGARNGGMGPFGAGTHIQEKYGIKNCTTKDAFDYLMNFNHWKIDARLASEYINSTAFTVKWLEDQGLSYTPMTGGVDGAVAMMESGYMHSFARHPDYPNEFFAACSLLTDRAKANKNIRIFLETPAKKLIKTGNAVTGLIAQDKNGNEIQVEAKAVIIATGGFSGNPEMIKKYTSYTYNRDLFATFEMPNLSGDGIRMAWDVGAARSEMMMGVYKGIPIYGGPGGTKNEWSILANPNLMVNLEGDRFLNEAMSDRYMMGNAIHRQTNGCGFMMFDSTIADIYRNQKSETESGGPPGMSSQFAAPINDVDKIVAEAKKLNYPYVFAADSLEGFCKYTGIDLNGLKTTIAEYNSFCKAGKDPIFYKEASNLLPLNGPKYYAVKFCCDSFGGVGGIKINHKTEVLNTTLRPIPGLYAGGHDANTMYADTYPAYHSGNFSSFAYTTGLMAAKNAAQYIQASS
jgi:fumarate reductase flavoprotein subunit